MPILVLSQESPISRADRLKLPMCSIEFTKRNCNQHLLNTNQQSPGFGDSWDETGTDITADPFGVHFEIKC